MKGKVALFHPWTGASLPMYRDGLVWEQLMSYYKFPKLCTRCRASSKKIHWHSWAKKAQLEPWCRLEECTGVHHWPYMCAFNGEPTLTVRGLCKDAVMDTQYKFAEHIPGIHIP